MESRALMVMVRFTEVLSLPSVLGNNYTVTYTYLCVFIKQWVFPLTFQAGRSCHSPLGEDRRDPGPPRKDRMTKFCGHNLFSLIVMQISFLFQNMNSLTAATLRGGLSASFWLQFSALKVHLLTSDCFRLLNSRVEVTNT